jgi:hypothetical protein
MPRKKPQPTEECPKCKQQKPEREFVHALDSNDPPVCGECYIVVVPDDDCQQPVKNPTRQLELFR